MKEKICCFLDADEQYVLKLTEYINTHHALIYKAMAFTSPEALKAAADNYDIELLAVSEAYDEEGVCADTECAAKVVLCDNSSQGCVNRYQPVEDIIKDMIACMNGYGTTFHSSEGQASIISIYSPATKCFKTTTAIAAAIVCGKQGKSLFVSLEQFAGLGNIFKNDRGGLSEAIYNYCAGGENAFGKILACAESAAGFDYLAPVSCADDIADIDDSEITRMLTMIASKGSYKYIITDVGCVFNRPWKLLENSDIILVPEPLDYMGGRKLADFERYLMMSGRSGVADRLLKFQMPYIDRIAGYEISMESVSCSEIQNVVRRCLNG